MALLVTSPSAARSMLHWLHLQPIDRVHSIAAPPSEPEPGASAMAALLMSQSEQVQPAARVQASAASAMAGGGFYWPELRAERRPSESYHVEDRFQPTVMRRKVSIPELG